MEPIKFNNNDKLPKDALKEYRPHKKRSTDMELTWENARAWQDEANEHKYGEEPKWGWDCQFKLDFDGSLLTIESRFYPPSFQPINGGWQGAVCVMSYDDLIHEEKFECKTLDELREQVERFISFYRETMILKLKS